MHASKRKALWDEAPVGKVAVVGMKDRKTKQIKAKVVKTTTQPELQGFVREAPNPDQRFTLTNTGLTLASRGLSTQRRPAQDQAVCGWPSHTNGIESFWATLKRAYQGTFHRFESQAPRSIYPRVLLSAQHPRQGHYCSDGIGCCWAGWSTIDVRRPCC